MSNSPEFIAARSAFLLAINILGPVGVINSIYSLYVWQTFLKQGGVYSDFMFAWFGAFFVNGILWMPLTVVWPIIPWGEEVMLQFTSFFATMTLTGTLIAYWANAGAMYYAFF